MKKIIFIHGYNSSPKRRKYQIISQELDKLGVEHSIPAFPGNKHPHSSEWLKIIDKEIKKTTKSIILIGGSLGTRATLLYLDKFEQKVDTVILIAAFNNNFEENRIRRNGNYSDFFDYALDIEKIKKLANRFIVMHSKDDKQIDYQQGIDISNELGAELRTYENMGHFCEEEKAEENAKCFLEIIKSAL